MSRRENYTRSLFGPLPVPSQETVVKTLEPHFPVFWECVMVPWDDFLGRRASDQLFSKLTEEESAIWLTVQINHNLRDYYDGNTNGVLVQEAHRKPLIIFNSQLVLSVKKLTTRMNRDRTKRVLTRSNYDTRRNVKYWDQQVVGRTPDLPRFILAYELLREVTAIKMYLACPKPNSKTVDWIHPIIAPAGIIKPRLARLDEAPVEDKGYEILPATNTEEEGNSAQ